VERGPERQAAYEGSPICTNDPLVEDLPQSLPPLVPPERMRVEQVSTMLWNEEELIDRRYGMPLDAIDARFGTNQIGCSWGAWLLHLMHLVLVVVLLALLLASQFVPTFKRVVTGALPAFMRVAGIDFDKSFNLWEIPGLTAQEEGLDYLMAGAFLVFILVAPILRVVSLLLLLLLPLRLETQKIIYTWSRRLVTFTATEVMLIATPLIGQTFGPISSQLLNDGILHACKPLEYVFEHDKHQGTCLRIDVYPLSGYWYKVAASIMMFVSGFDGSPTCKYIHRRLWPHDPHPPPSCIECCAKTRNARM